MSTLITVGKPFFDVSTQWKREKQTHSRQWEARWIDARALKEQIDSKQKPCVKSVLVRGFNLPCQILKISLGSKHCLAISTTGSLWAWGDGRVGVLGLGTRTQSKHVFPVQVDTLNKRNRQMKQFEKVSTAAVQIIACAAGACHSVALADTGEVYCCGTGKAVGLGAENAVHAYFSQVFLSEHVSRDGIATFDVQAHDEVIISTIATGHHHVLAAVSNSSTMWVWGSAKDGRLGIGNDCEDQSFPAKIHLPSCMRNNENLLKVSKFDKCKKGNRFIERVACGIAHSIVLTSWGEVFTWGLGRHGSLGHGNLLSEYIPRHLLFDTWIGGSNKMHSVPIHSKEPNNHTEIEAVCETTQQQHQFKTLSTRTNSIYLPNYVTAGGFSSIIVVGSPKKDRGSIYFTTCTCQPYNDCSNCACGVYYFGRVVTTTAGFGSSAEWPVTPSPRKIICPKRLCINHIVCGTTHVLVIARTQRNLNHPGIVNPNSCNFVFNIQPFQRQRQRIGFESLEKAVSAAPDSPSNRSKAILFCLFRCFINICIDRLNIVNFSNNS